MAQKFSVVAHLPGAIELTKRTSQNALKVDVKVGDFKQGTLVIARGSVEWWPDGNKVNAHRANWEKFAQVLEQYLPQRRSTRRRKDYPTLEESQAKAAKRSAAAKKAARVRKWRAAKRKAA